MIRVQRLTAWDVPIPLRKPIRHASYERHDSRNLVVRCQLEDGSVGWGEGLPRVYVTGDSIDSVWRHLTETDFDGLASQSFENAYLAAKAIDTLQLADVEPEPDVLIRDCFGNPVRCAIELAVLDAIGCSLQTSVGDLLATFPGVSPLLHQVESVQYSGAITSGNARKQWTSALKMKLFGFHQVKVKVGTAGIDDVACLKRVRTVLGSKVDIRLDANEAWTADTLLDHVQPLMRFQPTCLEQPLPHHAVSALGELRRKLSLPIMLDESLCCEPDARDAIQNRLCDVFNIRLSKCGGLLRSVRLVQLAADAGLAFQLGCQVGESGILSAAGRHFACNIGGARYLEGSYDRFLVRERLTKEDLTFKYGGRAPRLTRPGLGITVDHDQVSRLALRSMELLSAPQ
jgi:L-alanine-DL-glutamate epimerase-like enolase superfamily enzyme